VGSFSSLLIIMLTVHVDDEPADGPQHYVIITGFYEPYLLMYLDEIGIAVDCIIQLDSRIAPADMSLVGKHHVTVFILTVFLLEL